MNCSCAFHVDCAAPVDETVAQFTTERRHGPALRFDHYDVSVTEQDQRPATAIALDARVEIRASRRYVEHSRFNPIRLKELLQGQGRRTLVTRRVRSVDSDQLLQQLNCFRAGLGPVDVSSTTGRTSEKQEHHKQKANVHIDRLHRSTEYV